MLKIANIAVVGANSMASQWRTANSDTMRITAALGMMGEAERRAHRKSHY